VILTITAHEKGKTVEEGGGFIMTNTMWLAPRIAALDEIREFDMKYFKAIAGEEGLAAVQGLTAALAMFPAIKPMMETMQNEGSKLNGTPILTTSVMESVKSEAQMKESSQQSSGGRGGITGGLTRRVMGNRGQPQPKSTVFTTTRELLSIDTSATEADVAIPTGFKERK
jgi:hypothetical protein